MYSTSLPPRSKHRALCGYSLLELTLVVLIIGIMAAAVIPSFFSSNSAKLDAAAEIQAEAMRFARTEAMRRGKPIGFRQKNDGKRIRVFSLDTSGSPWTLVYDIYHPVSKKIWNIKLDEQPFAAADTVSNNRIYRGNCTGPSNVYFDPGGSARCVNPETVLVERYEVILTLGSESRTVTLDGFSGRVTIQ